MSSEYDAFSTKTTMGNISLGQPLKIANTNPSYAAPPDASSSKAATLEELRKKHAPNADKKTTASGEKGILDIHTILQIVDSLGSSSALPGMSPGLSKVNSKMNTTAPSTKKTVLQNTLYGALCSLSRKYGFDRVITVFNTALADGKISDIASTQRSVVSSALTYLIKNANENGPDNIQLPVTFKTVTEITKTPPTPVVNEVPDLYTQVYYTMETDPYMGYIKWLSNDEQTSVYTLRKIGDYYYETADAEIYDKSVQELITDLDIYCDPNYVDPTTKLPVTLTAKILDGFLSTQNTNIEKHSMEKHLGNGTGTTSSFMNFLESLMGYTGIIVNSIQTSHIPVSVLDQASITISLENYSKNMSMLRSMKTNASSAFKPTAPVISLFPDTSSLNNIITNLQTKGLTVVAGNTVRTLVNNIKSYV
jgi:hypothetical protein